jgi:hypothetical protein
MSDLEKKIENLAGEEGLCEEAGRLLKMALEAQKTGAMPDLSGMESSQSPFRDCHGYDHNCVRCDDMADSDMETKYIGEKGTCCVCVDHDCEAARREREIHPS